MVLGPAPTGHSYSPVAAIAVAFLLTVLPVWAFLTGGEAGWHAAAWGRWRTGLRVIDSAGVRASFGRVAVRNAVKLLPWQLAHFAVARMILGADDVVTLGITYTLSLLVPVVSIAMAWRDPLRRAAHDRIVGTRMIHASAG